MLLDQDDVVPELESPADVVDSGPGHAKVAVVYRTRGVPLLLIPPLLVIAAAVAIAILERSQQPAPRVVYLPAVPAAGESEARPEAPTRALAEDARTTIAATVPKSSVDASSPAAATRPDETPAPIAPASVAPEPIPLSKEPSIVSGSQGTVTRRDLEAPPEFPRADDEPTLPGRMAVVGPQAGGRVPVVGFDPEALRAVLDDPLPEAPPPAVDDPAVAAIPDRAPAEVFAPPDPGFNPVAERQFKAKADERRRLAEQRRYVIRSNSSAETRVRNAKIVQARRSADVRRAPFLEELRRIVKERGEAGAGEIEALCTRSGRETAVELLDSAFGELSSTAARLSTKGKVQRLRQWGVPEPIILDHLIDVESGDIGGRHGAKHQAELMLRAARMLLAIPLAAKPDADATVGVGRAGEARR
ncbi:MAG: hypothetical protein SFX72_18580 [Isosphaeraceae bacterium]|nr:hypothetical protein [Isosphaeraceae bacterium]